MQTKSGRLWLLSATEFAAAGKELTELLIERPTGGLKPRHGEDVSGECRLVSPCYRRTAFSFHGRALRGRGTSKIAANRSASKRITNGSITVQGPEVALPCRGGMAVDEALGAGADCGAGASSENLSCAAQRCRCTSEAQTFL